MLRDILLESTVPNGNELYHLGYLGRRGLRVVTVVQLLHHIRRKTDDGSYHSQCMGGQGTKNDATGLQLLPSELLAVKNGRNFLRIEGGRESLGIARRFDEKTP